MGLSDLGPKAATERPGHIAEAGFCGGLSSSVHPGRGTHEVSSAEAPDGRALGHASPLPPRCLPEGASDARAAPYMGSAGSVRSHWGQAAPIAHSQGAATGEGLRTPPQPLIAGAPDWLSGVILGNAGNFCYSNAVFLALAMALPVSPPITAVGKLLGKIWRAPASMLLLRKQGEWRQLTHAWPNPQLQHDAAEFLQHLAQHDGLVQDLSVWHTIAVGGEGAPRMDTGRGVILIPVRNDAYEPHSLLQDCVQAWHEQLQLHVVRSGTEFVVLQLNRFHRQGPFTRKDTTSIAMADGVVLLPIGGSDGDVQWQPYQILSLVVHLGPTPVSGHYRAVHFNAGDMCITDDNVRASRTNPADRIAERAYLVFLRKLQ